MKEFGFSKVTSRGFFEKSKPSSENHASSIKYKPIFKK
jgi:hypothetical protein